MEGEGERDVDGRVDEGGREGRNNRRVSRRRRKRVIE